MSFANSKGKIWYGLHFYPGVAEYQQPGADAFRVFLNEDTIRAMGPSFAGRPVFVEHVDEVDPNLDRLRGEADGWVIESFYNEADGKHWVKFITVSERADRAIARGMKLSNCYVPKSFGQGGLWNGVAYQKQVLDGEYEHLAIVRDPRYEESIILNADEFKQYNDEKQQELKRLANDGGQPVISLFRRSKVDNAADLVLMSVTLPKSKREMTIEQLVNSFDEHEMKQREPQMANPDHHVMVGNTKMTVNDLLMKHKQMCDELEAMRAKNTDDGGEAAAAEGGDADHVLENGDDEEAKKKALELAEHEDKEIKAAKAKNEADKKAADDAEKARAKAAAERLRNAGPGKKFETPPTLIFSGDKVARGKSRYGS